MLVFLSPLSLPPVSLPPCLRPSLSLSLLPFVSLLPTSTLSYLPPSFCPLAPCHHLFLFISFLSSPYSLLKVRSVQADEIWLSPNYQRLSCHITLAIYNPSQHTRDTYFGEFYKATAALGLHPRPHWGKHMPIDWKEVEMEALFPRIKDFARIRAKMDPQGIFLSDFLNNIFKFV